MQSRLPLEVLAYLLDEALRTEAMLLGRTTYEELAALWPARDGELADRLNGLPKYVVSSTLEILRGTTRRCSGGRPSRRSRG